MEALPAIPESRTEDEVLLAQLRAGEHEACETWVRSSTPRMLVVARRILDNEEDAREAIQDAFLSAFRSIDSFAGQSSLSTWLHRIVVNAALMKLRKRQRQSAMLIEDLLPAYLDDGHQAQPASPWKETPESALERKETRTIIRDAIVQLPEIHRIVLVLRDIEELSTEETAKLLGVTANVVKARLHRARQALRTLLDKHFREVP
jgi:RNA polymerase sigma-70 factor (ECF subfamily)